ncbi:MAG: ATP-binding protein [Lachnospiraceae bacterium]|nr:ATP-binding protein [Lachnospiraceae bacterium]
MELIILAGMPASGKTTFSKKLSKALGYPVLEKDEIKEELFDVIGFENYTQKRLMDTAATAVLLRCADSLLSGGQSLIMVNNFREDAKAAVEGLLEKHQCKAVFVFFGGDGDVFYQRYVERDNLHLRHLGHVLQEHYPPHPGDALEYTMTREEFAEKFEKLGMNEFHINGVERIDVDATYPETIDVEKLIAQIRETLQK